MENFNGVLQGPSNLWQWFLTLLMHRFDTGRSLGVSILAHLSRTARRRDLLLACDPLRRAGLWLGRLEQDGPQRQARRIAQFSSERLAQSVDNLIRIDPPRVRIMSISGLP